MLELLSTMLGVVGTSSGGSGTNASTANTFLTTLTTLALMKESNVVDKGLLQTYNSKYFVDILITFPLNEAKLKNISKKNYPNRGEKISSIVKSLELNSKKVQNATIKFLKDWKKIRPELSYKLFPYSNQITVQNANLHLVNNLAQLVPQLGILEIRKQILYFIQPILNITAPGIGPLLAWGPGAVGAKELWARGIDGYGVVLGSIDSGVRVTHYALRENYRDDDFSWHDPTNLSPLQPTDISGHGTHTAGLMCGSGPTQIGVAKAAKFIACRGCTVDSCSVSDLLTCGEFMLCPFKVDNPYEKDCSKAPHIINNSWGGGPPGDTSYRNLIKAWNYAGIIPVFAIGNAGPACSTAGSPGDDDKSLLISVGGTDILGRLGYFSSKGPSFYNTTKPEISAPGVFIYSASNANDDAYHIQSGTSMAAPFVSGVIALMLQKNGNLTLAQVQERLIAGAKNGNLTDSEPIHCSKKLNRGVLYPNNAFGHGIVSAINSVW